MLVRTAVVEKNSENINHLTNSPACGYSAIIHSFGIFSDLGPTLPKLPPKCGNP